MSYADGPGQLDWANQPNPFRRYEGAPLVRLPLLAAHEAPRSPYYDDPYHRGSVPSAPLTIHTLSRLLQYALAISAWKQAGATCTRPAASWRPGRDAHTFSVCA